MLQHMEPNCPRSLGYISCTNILLLNVSFQSCLKALSLQKHSTNQCFSICLLQFELKLFLKVASIFTRFNCQFTSCVCFTSLAAVYLWHRQPRRYDDRPPDHWLRVHGCQHHRELWDAGEWRPPRSNHGPGGAERLADHGPSEAAQGLREHLDRHPRHRQVLEGCLSWCVHPL